MMDSEGKQIDALEVTPPHGNRVDVPSSSVNPPFGIGGAALSAEEERMQEKQVLPVGKYTFLSEVLYRIDQVSLGNKNDRLADFENRMLEWLYLLDPKGKLSLAGFENILKFFYSNDPGKLSQVEIDRVIQQNIEGNFDSTRINVRVRQTDLLQLLGVKEGFEAVFGNREAEKVEEERLRASKKPNGETAVSFTMAPPAPLPIDEDFLPPSSLETKKANGSQAAQSRQFVFAPSLDEESDRITEDNIPLPAELAQGSIELNELPQVEDEVRVERGQRMPILEGELIDFPEEPKIEIIDIDPELRADSSITELVHVGLEKGMPIAKKIFFRCLFHSLINKPKGEKEITQPEMDAYFAEARVLIAGVKGKIKKWQRDAAAPDSIINYIANFSLDAEENIAEVNQFLAEYFKEKGLSFVDAEQCETRIKNKENFYRFLFSDLLGEDKVTNARLKRELRKAERKFVQLKRYIRSVLQREATGRLDKDIENYGEQVLDDPCLLFYIRQFSFENPICQSEVTDWIRRSFNDDSLSFFEETVSAAEMDAELKQRGKNFVEFSRVFNNSFSVYITQNTGLIARQGVMLPLEEREILEMAQAAFNRVDLLLTYSREEGGKERCFKEMMEDLYASFRNNGYSFQREIFWQNFEPLFTLYLNQQENSNIPRDYCVYLEQVKEIDRLAEQVYFSLYQNWGNLDDVLAAMHEKLAERYRFETNEECFLRNFAPNLNQYLQESGIADNGGVIAPLQEAHILEMAQSAYQQLAPLFYVSEGQNFGDEEMQAAVKKMLVDNKYSFLKEAFYQYFNPWLTNYLQNVCRVQESTNCIFPAQVREIDLRVSEALRTLYPAIPEGSPIIAEVQTCLYADLKNLGYTVFVDNAKAFAWSFLPSLEATLAGIQMENGGTAVLTPLQEMNLLKEAKRYFKQMQSVLAFSSQEESDKCFEEIKANLYRYLQEQRGFSIKKAGEVESADADLQITDDVLAGFSKEAELTVPVWLQQYNEGGRLQMPLDVLRGNILRRLLSPPAPVKTAKASRATRNLSFTRGASEFVRSLPLCKRMPFAELQRKFYPTLDRIIAAKMKELGLKDQRDPERMLTQDQFEEGLGPYFKNPDNLFKFLSKGNWSSIMREVKFSHEGEELLASELFAEEQMLLKELLLKNQTIFAARHCLKNLLLAFSPGLDAALQMNVYPVLSGNTKILFAKVETLLPLVYEKLGIEQESVLGKSKLFKDFVSQKVTAFVKTQKDREATLKSNQIYEKLDLNKLQKALSKTLDATPLLTLIRNASFEGYFKKLAKDLKWGFDFDKLETFYQGEIRAMVGENISSRVPEFAKTEIFSKELPENILTPNREIRQGKREDLIQRLKSALNVSASAGNEISRVIEKTVDDFLGGLVARKPIRRKSSPVQKSGGFWENARNFFRI